MTEFTLQRHEDPSGVSGTGEVAWGVEWPDGAVAVRWPGHHPSTAAWGDIRDMESVHGHSGKTLVEYAPDYARLVAAYKRVVPYLLNSKPHSLPLQVAPHPDHPDRLRLILVNYPTWRWWIALLDGSSDAASHEEVDGELRHTWITSDGNVWVVWHSPIPGRLVASERFVVPIEDPEGEQ